MLSNIRVLAVMKWSTQWGYHACKRYYCDAICANVLEKYMKRQVRHSRYLNLPNTLSSCDEVDMVKGVLHKERMD